MEKGEVFVYGMHVSPYEKGNIFNKDPLRPRKLLLHRSEIRKLIGKMAQKGYTLVPLQVYFKVRNSMTWGRTSPRRIRSGRQRENLK